MLMSGSDVDTQVLVVPEGEPVGRDAEYPVVQILIVGMLETGPAYKLPIVRGIEFGGAEYGNTPAENDLRIAHHVGEINPKSPVADLQLVAEAEHPFISSVPIADHICAVKQAQRSVVALILERVGHGVERLLPVRRTDCLKEESRALSIVHPTGLEAPLVALEVVVERGHHVPMDLVVVLLQLESAKSDNLFAGGQDEVARIILEISPVAPVHVIRTPCVLIQWLRISAEPMVADAEREFVRNVSLEKRIK